MIFIFWCLVFLVFYTYVGYGVLMFVLTKVTNTEKKNQTLTYLYHFDVAFVVAAYNEQSDIIEKIENSLNFEYPRDKIHFIYITDGSDDNTVNLIKNFDWPKDISWKLFHKPERQGKIAAVHRVMPELQQEIIIYSDANTMVNPEAVNEIVKHYNNPQIGGVAGEKRISDSVAAAAENTEGVYWKYESFLKKLDAKFYSVVGAAGELFSIRRSLYENVPLDTLVEDFYLTMRIAQKGYRVMYEPNAYAVENSSASIGDELKRKIRIAAGGIQAIIRLAPLLNIFKYGKLSFQYISHRVLRWTLAPAAMPLIFMLNIYLHLQHGGLYSWILMAQVCFYLMALAGWILEKKQMRFKLFFVPYYFCMMNYALFRGVFRYFKGNQSVIWEKAKRAT